MDENTPRADELRAVAERLRIRIGDLDLIDRALTHASISCEQKHPAQDYESLEFLGDSVLGLAISHLLFERVPDRNPGEYSRMRASLVNRRCLARAAKRLDIAPAIRLGKGEELSGGRQRAALLADCLEALIGALYLDQGWEAARAFAVEALEGEVENVCSRGSEWDYKSRLQQYCQAERYGLPEFVVVRSEGPDHRKEFETEVLICGQARGRGTGHSKKEAEQNAACEALQKEGFHFD
jgi:ribonuclease III